jgi:hypothetical protein
VGKERVDTGISLVRLVGSAASSVVVVAWSVIGCTIHVIS